MPVAQFSEIDIFPRNRVFGHSYLRTSATNKSPNKNWEQLIFADSSQSTAGTLQ